MDCIRCSLGFAGGHSGLWIGGPRQLLPGLLPRSRYKYSTSQIAGAMRPGGRQSAGTKAQDRAGTTHSVFPSGLGLLCPSPGSFRDKPLPQPLPSLLHVLHRLHHGRVRATEEGEGALDSSRRCEAPAAVPGSPVQQAFPGPLQTCEATSSLGLGSSLRGPLQWERGSLLWGPSIPGYHPGKPPSGNRASCWAKQGALGQPPGPDWLLL